MQLKMLNLCNNKKKHFVNNYEIKCLFNEKIMKTRTIIFPWWSHYNIDH